MNPLTSTDAYGSVSAANTLTIQRLLPGPIERLWSYLTDGELRSKWLAGGDMKLEAGAPFEFVWRNDELSDEPAERPAGFPEEERMQSRITEVAAPHRISFTWAGSDDVTFELEPHGDAVMLTVTHRRLPSRETLLQVAAGWHMHLDILVARTAGDAPAAFWPGWIRLRDEYDARLPA